MSNTCPKCGAQIRPNARFCATCGSSLAQNPAASAQYSPPPAPFNSPQPPQSQQPPQGGWQQGQSYQPAVPAGLPQQQPYQPPASYASPSIYSPSPAGQVDGSMRALDERKAILAQNIQQAVARGGRVESQSDTMAVVIYGKPVNHVLHFLIGLFTFAIWWIVWIILVITGGEKRQMITIDEYGNVLVQKA